MARKVYDTTIGDKKYAFRESEVVVIEKPRLIYPAEVKDCIPVGCVDYTLETAQEILEQRLGFKPATLQKPYYMPHPNVERTLPKTGQVYVKKTCSGFIQAEIDEKSSRLSQRLTVRGLTVSGLEKDVQETYDSLIQFPEIAETLFELGQASRLPVYTVGNYPKARETIAVEAGEIITPEAQSLDYISGRFLSVDVPKLITSRYVKVNPKGFLVLDEISDWPIFFSEDEECITFYQRLRDFRLTYDKENKKS